MDVFSPELNPPVKLTAKHRALAPSYSYGMDVTSTRQHNLRTLVDQLAAALGTQKAVAIRLDMSPSYLNQLLGGKKMGDDVARKIERLGSLSHGWMDVAHDGRTESATNQASQPLRIDPEIIASALRLLRLTFSNLDIDDFDNELDGTPLAYAYEYLYRRGEVTVTPDNLIDFSKALADRLRERNGNEEEVARARDHGSASSGHRSARRKA